MQGLAVVNGFQQRARKRALARLPTPQGWGEEQLEQRAAKSREAMRKYDLMPPEYRALVHEYGMKVRAMMRDGYTPEQIKRELER